MKSFSQKLGSDLIWGWNNVVVFFCFLVGSILYGKNPDDPSSLVAFSLSAAKDASLAGHIDNNEVNALGYITKIWAVILDEQDDVIIVGEADPALPRMYIDDVVVALRTINKVKSGESPGVSIEPLTPNSSTQKVVYFAGIDTTHYGKVCFQADYLLKRLSLGFSSTGIEGFPSEWELALHNMKAGRQLDPWVRSVGRSWFFPMRVEIIKDQNCATVTMATMEVQTDLDRELELPQEYLSLKANQLTKILKENPEAVSVIYARLFTQYYEDIAVHFPVLTQLKNILVLSGLMSKLLDESIIQNLKYWLNEYSVKNVSNPVEVPALHRGVNGLAYNSFMWGRVFGVYEVKDAWSEGVLSKIPKYIKQAALRSRPSRKAISWIIPLELGSPKNWSKNLLEDAQKNESSRIVRSSAQSDQPPNDISPFHANKSAATDLFNTNKPLKTSDWRPATQGANLLLFKGNLFFSTGGFEAFSPDGRFSVAEAVVSTGIPINVQLTLANRFEISLTIPLIFRIQFEDRPSRLPGIKDNLVAHGGGMENPIITNRILVLTGVKNGRWIFPSVILENSFIMSISKKIFEGTSGEPDFGDPLVVRFGRDNWRGSHGLSMLMPINRSITFSSSGEFQTDWSNSIRGEGDRIITGGSMYWLFEKDAGLFSGIHYRTSLMREQIDSSPLTTTFWTNEGHQFSLSLSFPTRSGINSLSLGWFAPGAQTKKGGIFLMSVELGGTSLWDKRKWF